MPDTLHPAWPAPLHLTLRRHASGPGWQAELHDRAAPRQFDSMAELVAWLGTLDKLPPSPAPLPGSPPHGIR